MIRIFLVKDGEAVICVNVDNDTDAEALAEAGARELTDDERAVFGDSTQLAGGPGTVVEGSDVATATVTWTEPEADPQVRIAEIETELSALDLLAVRPLRAILSATQAGSDPEEEDVARLADLEVQAVTLRDELSALA
jgi:hypothetical protein